MVYTVKQLSDLAGVSPRTLHYYDEIGLLKPPSIGDNGYRYYNEESALRLQQILFYRELDVPLKEIQRIISSPNFNPLDALEKHFDDAGSDRLDGLRLDWPDAWLLVRPSNTEPIVRAVAEAKNEKEARRLCDEAGKILRARGG